jgi:hypothetical protein
LVFLQYLLGFRHLGEVAAIIPLTMAAEPTRQTFYTGGPPVTDAVLDEFSEFAAGLDAAAEQRATVAAFRDYVRRGPALDPGAEVARRIERCVAEGRAAAFIRLGDGEGSLLALALENYPALADYCVRWMSVKQFGDIGVLGRAAPEVLPAFEAALRDADLLGFPGPSGANSLLRRSPREKYVRPVYGLACAHRYLTRFADKLQLESKTGAPADFHRALLPHYEALISGRTIGIITCHPALESALRTRLGATGVDLRTVPERAANTPNARVDTRHWPERFRELCRELEQIDPGTLWLVGAGILGKIYCGVIRAAGGVAVDIGNVADIWAGRTTRSYGQVAGQVAAWSIV